MARDAVCAGYSRAIVTQPCAVESENVDRTQLYLAKEENGRIAESIHVVVAIVIVQRLNGARRCAGACQWRCRSCA